MTSKLIIASSLRQAINTAVIDWGWVRIGVDSFRMTSGWRFDGDIVRYCNRPHQLYGLITARWRTIGDLPTYRDQATTIYLGYGYQDHPDWFLMRAIIEQRGYRVLYGP